MGTKFSNIIAPVAAEQQFEEKNIDHCPPRKSGARKKSDALSEINEKNKTSLYIPPSIFKELKHFSVDEGRKVNDVIIDAVALYLKKVKKSKRDDAEELKSHDGMDVKSQNAEESTCHDSIET